MMKKELYVKCNLDDLQKIESAILRRFDKIYYSPKVPALKRISEDCVRDLIVKIGAWISENAWYIRADEYARISLDVDEQTYRIYVRNAFLSELKSIIEKATSLVPEFRFVKSGEMWKC